MNERIRQLAEQASKEAFPVGSMAWMETFAESIVRECAKKGFDIFDEVPGAPASDLQFYVRDRIKEHFGVES
jgi:hypothetical protein